MRYPTIDALDTRIESIISRKVKYYYTDWKNYDRPKYMGYKGSIDRRDRRLVLIARESGTYLLRESDVAKGNTNAAYIYDYYNGNGGGTDNDFYMIDIDALTIKKIAGGKTQ